MAVRAFLHYALEVPDPAVGQRYYRDFGLMDATGQGDVVRLRAAKQQRENVLLFAGRRKRLHHLCFGAPGEAFAQVRQSLSRVGVNEVDPPRGAPEEGIWVKDPDGNLVNIRDETPDPEPGDPPLLLNAPGHAPRQAIRGCPERG